MLNHTDKTKVYLLNTQVRVALCQQKYLLLKVVSRGYIQVT